MTTTPSPLLSGRFGGQEPTFKSVPHPELPSVGQVVIDLAAKAKLTLDPWQSAWLIDVCRRFPSGEWAASEGAIFVARQNGKNGAVEARQLAGLFVASLGERQALHTAHKMSTAKEHYRRLKALIESSPALMRRKPVFKQSNEECSIEIPALKTKLRFLARSTGGGRGFTGDVLYIDEALYFTAAMQLDILPTVSARPNAQIIYMSSPPTEKINDPFCWDLRERAQSGDPELVYYEWSVTDADDWHSADVWIRLNPAFGRRLTMRTISREYNALRRSNLRGFAIERLGYWPPKPVVIDDDRPPEIDGEKWADCKVADVAKLPASVPERVFYVDSTRGREWTTVAVAYEVGGDVVVELAKREPGLLWAVDYLAERAPSVVAIAVDSRSPASALVGELAARGVTVWTLSSGESSAALVAFTARVDVGTVRHLGDPVLDGSVAGAVTRDVGASKVWDEEASTSDVSPVRAVSGAVGLLPKARAWSKKRKPRKAVVRGYR